MVEPFFLSLTEWDFVDGEVLNDKIDMTYNIH